MSKQPYYYQHESAYKSIQTKGYVGWQKKDKSEFRDISTEEAIQPFIEELFVDRKGKRALDLGCGSGPTAHFLDDLGFKVVGIDVSPTAIELAKAMSAEFNRKIDYVCGDVTALEQFGPVFDLVYDSHCLHCIVSEGDRLKTFKAIQRSLAPGGYFLLDTMVYTSGVPWLEKPEPLRFDENYILWHQVKSDNWSDLEEKEGALWCPQRRIYPSDRILSELSQAHFKIKKYEIKKQNEGTDMLRAICTV